MSEQRRCVRWGLSGINAAIEWQDDGPGDFTIATIANNQIRITFPATLLNPTEAFFICQKWANVNTVSLANEYFAVLDVTATSITVVPYFNYGANFQPLAGCLEVVGDFDI